MGAGSSRYRQIGAVLRRHGLGVLAGVLGLGGLVPFHRGALGHARQEDPYTNPEHVRVALEELGPTFVKLGQILSTRHDLLPAAWVAEFAKLQDDVAAAPWEGIRDVLREELGADPEHVFAQFDPVPLAAACTLLLAPNYYRGWESTAATIHLFVRTPLRQLRRRRH